MRPSNSNGNGSQVARRWAELWTARRSWLRTVVWSRVPGPEAVDEVMQEVALAAMRQGSVPAEQDQAFAWLYRVAVRQALLYRRRHRRQCDHIGRYARGAETPDTAGPLDWMLRQERGALVRVAIERLPRGDREMILLRYGEDWTSEQMARHLGVRPGTIDTRLYRARQRLREILLELGAESP